ncbi:MAG: OFA family MFS transporter [Planctomycetota bacterium]|nr:OFA family MFS transporter [Planctomycetota bacterium]
MSENTKVMNRNVVVVGAILIQLCLGAIYAWSVFTKKITAVDGGYGFSASEAMWIFSAGLASFAIVMVLAGRLMPKIGPRKLAIAGGLVLGAGYVLGGFLGKTFAAQLICIGIIGGSGIGLAYVVPIAVGVKWFPDKKGLISGLGVAGFGFGALLWVKLAGGIGNFQGLLNITSIFGLPGVQSVFIIYGVAFAALVLLGSFVMVNPPEGFKPAGWEPPAPHEKASGAIDLHSGQMLKTPQYWGLLLMFIGSGLAGLMVIGCIKLFGIDALQASKAARDTTSAGKMADNAMAWYAILNGLGRIAWGAASDKIGRKIALFLMCLFQGVIMLLFFKMGGTEIGLIVGACIIGFNFGGNFALFPAATADFFGNKNVGKNYGWVFLAYGVAGIAGPQVAGYFKDAAKGGEVTAWIMPFVIGGVACLVAAVIGLTLKAPKKAAA